MKKKKRAAKKQTKIRRTDVAWVVAMHDSQMRAKSFHVAHARHKGKLLCGRDAIDRWAGYKRRTIRLWAKPAPYERHCRRCLHVLFPPPPPKRRAKR